MIRIKRNPRNEKIINDLIIKRKRIRSEPPVFHELYLRRKLKPSPFLLKDGEKFWENRNKRKNI